MQRFARVLISFCVVIAFAISASGWAPAHAAAGHHPVAGVSEGGHGGHLSAKHNDVAAQASGEATCADGDCSKSETASEACCPAFCNAGVAAAEPDVEILYARTTPRVQARAPALVGTAPAELLRPPRTAAALLV